MFGTGIQSSSEDSRLSIFVYEKKSRRKSIRIGRALLILSFVFIFSAVVFAQTGAKKRRPAPYEYGRVIINNYSERANLAPVIFDHWLHRTKFTCRLCHVDIGFAMKANATAIKAADNSTGHYCGTCHNGKIIIDGKKMFASCIKAKDLTWEEKTTCRRCHSLGWNVKPAYDFENVTRGLPIERFGNGLIGKRPKLRDLSSLLISLRGSRSGESPSPHRRILNSGQKWKECLTLSSPTRSTQCGTAASCAIQRYSSE